MSKATGKKVKLIKSNNKSWKLEKVHRQIKSFTMDLDRRRDASDIRSDKIQSAPLDLIDMLF